MVFIKRIARFMCSGLLSVAVIGGAWGSAGVATGVGLAAFSFVPSAHAQDDDNEGSSRRRSAQLDPAVARVIQDIFVVIQEERYPEALTQLNQLIAQRGDRMKAYDKAVTYELRGTVKVNLEDYRGALSDFQTALNSNGFPPERNNQLRYFIAQLYFQLEQYQKAISGLNEWIRSAQAAGETVDPNAYYLLAAAYVQLTPPNYRAAVGPAEKVVASRGSSAEPKKSDFDLLNLIYSELNETRKRAALLERMINIWPNERGYWTQLSGLYSTTGRDKEAFSVLEVAYKAGLLTKENELKTLANYYSFFDNPYRAAKLIQREMDAGRIKRNLDNLVLLSQVLSQAREHKRAIPVLREASKLSSAGKLSYRLGQVLVADEQYKAAETALRTALRKGGMSSKETGDAWLLLGTARFSQAGPGDRAQRTKAREAFAKATQYSTSARQARQWLDYIKAIDDTEALQDKLECDQKIDARKDDVNRIRTQAQVCRLQNDPNCERFDQLLSEAKSDLDALMTTSCGRKAPPSPEASTEAATGGEGELESATEADEAAGAEE
ncbi:MAG: tetratricopeptide repeat protein [Pseudomonadota bacterium]